MTSTKTDSDVAEKQVTHTARKLTPAENVILTIKVLVGFGLLGAVLWGINAWTVAR